MSEATVLERETKEIMEKVVKAMNRRTIEAGYAAITAVLAGMIACDVATADREALVDSLAAAVKDLIVEFDGEPSLQ